jgi:hypothetical protein
MSISVHLDATTTSLFEKKKKKNRSQTDHSLLGRACGKVFCDNCASQRIELPADYGYDGPQRVCVKCQPALRDVQKQGHELEMTAIFYLRSTTAQFVRALPEVGWRSVFEKAFFTTKTADGATRVLELIDASKSPLALESESKRVAFKSLMSRLPTHPFISSFTSVAGGGTEFAEYFRDKDQLIVSTAVAPGGSVKDRIFNVANPLGAPLRHQVRPRRQGPRAHAAPLRLLWPPRARGAQARHQARNRTPRPPQRQRARRQRQAAARLRRALGVRLEHRRGQRTARLDGAARRRQHRHRGGQRASLWRAAL